MSPTHANKKGVRYRYYVSQALLQNRKAEAGSIAREHKLLTDADVLALTAILMEMAERGERKGEAAIKVPETSVSRKR
jgi:site-specific DNA recombinase